MSRRKNRYQRRQQKRAEKQKLSIGKCDDFERVASLNSLYIAAKKASNGVSWKASVQRYMLSILFKIQQTRRELLAGKDVRRGFIEFDLCERGKVRHIKSVHFYERVVQKALCKFVLYPTLTNDIIFDNCASQKYKGTLFATKRLEKHLKWYYRRYKRNGYILMIDFKGYFESIFHEPLKQTFRDKFSNAEIIKLSDDFVDAFGDRGLGLGSETSQINAIHHINEVDHFIKEVERIKCYGRYMDDSYIIHPDKEYLQELLNKLEEKLSRLGVVINRKKTHIINLKHGFTYLKTKFYLTESGKVIQKPCRENITRERRKLKKQAKLLQNNVLSYEDINQSYQSCIGQMQHKNAYRTVRSLEMLFTKLFKKEK